MRVPSITQLKNGPPSVDLLTAAAVLRIGRTKAYELARRGEFPVKVIRVGGSWRVPVTGLLELLGISPDAADPRTPARLSSKRTDI
jgi:hypothetical protein